MALTAEGQDKLREKPQLEQKRVWAHGSDGLGDKCPRSNKPIFTDPEKAPGVCRAPICTNDHWYARGTVTRDKKSKKVLLRDGKPVNE